MEQCLPLQETVLLYFTSNFCFKEGNSVGVFSSSIRVDGVVAAREFLQVKRKGVSRTTVAWQEKL